MANFESESTTDPIKMMVLGDTGSGKTGGLASLVAGGFNVRLIDFDNGTDVLKGYLRDPKSIYTKAHPEGLWTAEQAATITSRFRYETCIDKKIAYRGSITTTTASGWQRAVNLLENWKTSDASYGPVSSWTSRDILVIDTLTFATKRALDFNMSMNKNLGSMPAFTRDYRPAQFFIENLLGLLYDPSVKCNVIVTCHIAWFTESVQTTDKEGKPSMSANSPVSSNRKGYPDTVGQALWLKIGRYFNNVVQAKTVSAGRRALSTENDLNLEMLKTSAPLTVKSRYPIDTGYLELFRDLGATIATTPKLVSAAQ